MAFGPDCEFRTMTQCARHYRGHVFDEWAYCQEIRNRTEKQHCLGLSLRLPSSKDAREMAAVREEWEQGLLEHTEEAVGTFLMRVEGLARAAMRGPVLLAASEPFSLPAVMAAWREASSIAPTMDDPAYDALPGRVHEVVSELLSSDPTPGEALSRVLSYESEESPWQADVRRVVATFATRTFNEAVTAQLAEEEYATKVWVAHGDGSTRHSHREADGQEVELADRFLVGGSLLLYPGDPSGPPSETANCRCVLVGGMTQLEWLEYKHPRHKNGKFRPKTGADRDLEAKIDAGVESKSGPGAEPAGVEDSAPSPETETPDTTPEPEAETPSAPAPEAPSAPEPEAPSTPDPGGVDPSAFEPMDYGDLRVHGYYKGDAQPESFEAPSIVGLTPEQSEAVEAYVKENVVHQINGPLREGRTPTGDLDGFWDPEETGGELIDYLDQAVAAGSLNKDAELWRGLIISDSELPGYVPGATITDKAFWSTSMSERRAREFMDIRAAGGRKQGQSYLMRILAPKGTTGMKGMDAEEEIILPRGASARVVSVDGNVITVVME